MAAYRYRQDIDLAKRYGATKVIIHGGYNPWIYFPVWYMEQSILFWKDFLKNNLGVEIGLENVLETDALIDHRSNANRGLDEQPTIHEGVTAHVLEKKGIISDRCEINRQIKADNALLRELKATVKNDACGHRFSACPRRSYGGYPK